MYEIIREYIILDIMKKLVLIIEFCHYCGIIFKQFNFKNIVFKIINQDEDDYSIRILNPLELTLLDIVTSTNKNYILSINDIILSGSGSRILYNYVSPEQLTRRNVMYSSFKADIYALGSLMFYFLTGKHPFIGNSPTEFIRNIRRRIFSTNINSIYTTECKWFVYSLLNSNPEHRPSIYKVKYMPWLLMSKENINYKLVIIHTFKLNLNIFPCNIRDIIMILYTFYYINQDNQVVPSE